MSRVKLHYKYSFRALPKDLFLALTSTSYLQNWIASRVDFDEPTGVYTFHWQNYRESARIAEKEKNKFIKWEWVDSADRGPGEYVSFRITQIAGDEFIDLFVEDFCEDGEEQALGAGWEKQMRRLEKLVN